MKTFYFKIIRKPYTYPLIFKRDADSWQSVLLEFPDAIEIDQTDIMSRPL